MNRAAATFTGLAIALFASPLFIAVYRGLTGESHSDWQVAGRELGVFLLVGLLIWIVKSKEKLPLTSVGLRAAAWKTSLLRGVGLGVVVLIVTVGLFLLLQVVGIRLGEERANVFHPSLLIVTLTVLRAGVSEELFYRGFAIERLQSLTGGKLIAWVVPLVIFAAAHYRQGAGGVIAALILGGIFTAFYWRYRDLLANMTAHALADFVLNVILPLVSGN